DDKVAIAHNKSSSSTERTFSRAASISPWRRASVTPRTLSRSRTIPRRRGLRRQLSRAGKGGAGPEEAAAGRRRSVGSSIPGSRSNGSEHVLLKPLYFPLGGSMFVQLFPVTIRVAFVLAPAEGVELQPVALAELGRARSCGQDHCRRSGRKARPFNDTILEE